jgi:hypothetical protein
VHEKACSHFCGADFIVVENSGGYICIAAFNPYCSGVKAEKRNWAVIVSTYKQSIENI